MNRLTVLLALVLCATLLITARSVGLKADLRPVDLDQRAAEIGPFGPAEAGHYVPHAATTSQLVVREAYLMGTRAALAVHAPTRARGLATLETALSVLENAERELSTWRESSEISSLNRQPVGVPWQAPDGLCRMFADVWRWYQVTDGAFDPGIGRLLKAWDIHGKGAVPDPQRARQIRSISGLAHISFDATRCTLQRQADATIDVGAFGKGEALDRVALATGDLPWMVDLGGQVSVGGTAPLNGWRVAVADPRDRDRPFLHLRLTKGSLSTSGASERSLVVNGRRVNHIFDPRTGAPAPFTGSVSVWHRQGLAADALSTALVVMGPDEGLRWADAHAIAAVYLIPDGSRTRIATTSAFNTADAVRFIERE